MGYLKGIPTPVLQSAADFPISMIASGNHTVIKCGLVREDVKINHPDKLKFIAAWGNVYKILWIFPIYMV